MTLLVIDKVEVATCNLNSKFYNSILLRDAHYIGTVQYQLSAVISVIILFLVLANIGYLIVYAHFWLL